MQVKFPTLRDKLSIGIIFESLGQGLKGLSAFLELVGVQRNTLGVPIWYVARIGPKGCILGVPA